MDTDSTAKNGDERNRLIYHHNGILWSEVFLGFLMGIAFFTMTFVISQSILSIISILPFAYLIWYTLYRQKTSYAIYENRIEFYNENSPSLKEIIDNDDIFQVRYEDEFGVGYDTKFWVIYAYLKKNHRSNSKKIKDNYVRLFIKPSNKVDRIIKILQFYKGQKKEIYILTKFKEINKALELKNWNNP